MSSMNLNTLPSSSCDGTGRFMTASGTSTVGEVGVANLEKLTCWAAGAACALVIARV